MSATLARSHDASAGPVSGQQAGIERHGLLVYTLIAYAVTWVLLVLGYIGVQAGRLDPDGAYIGIATTFAPAGPLFAALIVIARSRGRAGLAELGRSMVRWRVHPGWYAYVFLGIPVLATAGVVAVNGAAAFTAFADNFTVVISQVPLGILSIAVFTGIPEEPGWRGYAQPWANRRFAPVVAALVVSVIWALWHLPNALFSGTPADAALHVVATIVSGVVLAWIYNSTGGSLFVVMLAHGANNAMGGLFTSVLTDTPAGMSAGGYYVMSSVVWGVVAVVVIALTRGRIGLPRESEVTVPPRRP